MIFDWLCGSDRFSTHEKWSVILESSETQSKIINPPLREIHLFPHSFAKSLNYSMFMRMLHFIFHP
jgi:hypothetical protein